MVFEKELHTISFEKFQKPLKYMKNNLICSDANMYLTVGSLIDINNIITDSNNITISKVNVKPCEYDKMHMDKDLQRNFIN